MKGYYSDPQTFNPYSYCRNNPLKYTDPDGRLDPISTFCLGVGLMTLGGIIKSGRYLLEDPNPTIKGGVNNFLVGFSSTFTSGVKIVTGGASILLSPAIGVSEGRIEHELEKVGALAGAEGISDPGSRSTSDSIEDALSNTIGDYVGNMASPQVGAIGGEIIGEITDELVGELPSIQRFKPIEFPSINPSDMGYKDPYRWGR